MRTSRCATGGTVDAWPGRPFLADCPTRLGADLIGDRWTAVVLHGLRHRPRRPGELREHIGGVSQKVLTATLRRLERDGLVSRRRYAEAPPRVEYSLTAAGRDLLVPLDALAAWVERHGDAVRTAQERLASE